MKLGLLVDADALAAVRAACLADADARQRRRERDRLRRVDSATRRQRLIRDRARRAELDAVYVANFAARIRALYPAAPEGVETRIAKHACLKHSRRVGRSAAAKAFDDRMIRLAVVASIRHERTEYDALLKEGVGRVKARKRVKRMIDAMLEAWSARP